jgi:hypothetical protein
MNNVWILIEDTEFDGPKILGVFADAGKAYVCREAKVHTSYHAGNRHANLFFRVEQHEVLYS